MGKPHHRLEVWKRALAFVKSVYELTSSFPGDEKFGLVSQMRRAAVSVPSNIAEGSARNSRKEFVNFLHIAQGSIAELETQVLVSQELGFADEKALAWLLAELDEISKMIIGLQKSLRRHM
ncbi:MAG: four helix bundle protein [Thermodesulfobacteriota bacterium]|nr:four helix bundle protein [Thermodesulfobacteriota bacterium]